MNYLEEVDGLLAQIELMPTLPFAHLAPHQAALARHAIETELMKQDTTDPLDVSQLLPLNILRTIGQTMSSVTLDVTIKSKDVNLVWLVIENGAIIEDTTFKLACEYDTIEIVRLLLELPLEREVNPAANDNEALLNSSYYGQLEIVRLLLDLPVERGVNPAACDNESLRFACLHGYTDIVRLLLNLPVERGVNPSACDNEALWFACLHGYTDIVRLLLDLPVERGVNPAACDNEAIQGACRKGHTKIVRVILELPLEKRSKSCSE